MTNPFDDDGPRTTNPFDDDTTEPSLAAPPTAASPHYDGDIGGAMARSTFRADGGGVLEHSSAAGESSSWQDLGDLPYRRVGLYAGVEWGREKKNTGQSDPNDMRHENEEQVGLSRFPKSYVETVRAHQDAVLGSSGESEVARLLSTTTATFVAGCPNGGPIATVTVPLATGPTGGQSSSGFGPRTTIRVMNNSGLLLASIPFPSQDLALTVQSNRLPLHRTPGDILAIGFTSRCILVVVLRDSLTLCYDLAGNCVLPPFFSLPHSSSMKGGSPNRSHTVATTGMDLLEASVFEGGVAVLGADMNSAVVELLDEFDDPSYADGADVSARRISATIPTQREQQQYRAGQQNQQQTPRSFLLNNTYYALVTTLPTGMFARSNHLGFQCIAVLPRQYAPSGRPELFLSTSDGSVVQAGMNPSTSPNNGFTDVDCRTKIGGMNEMGQVSPIVSMKFAPNGRFLACFTSNSILTVVSTTFESKILEFDTSAGSRSPPRDMGWCGEDSVVLHWKNLGVLMVGPFGDFLRFSFGEGADDSPNKQPEVYLVPEVDCCRVITSCSVEILQRVPPVTADLLRIGSIEPGALLLDASEAFDAGSPNADEAARSITQREGLLEEAILQCIDSAVGEFEVDVQKRMLTAASYGLHFACKDESHRSRAPGRPTPEAATFVRCSRKIRVLNAVRRRATGFAMTSTQYDLVMPKGVVARLMASGRASQAASIADYLKLGKRVSDLARASKAAAFVTCQSSLTDTQIAEEAIRIIRGEDQDATKPGPSLSSGVFASVALAAHRAGRRGVTDLLILKEQSPADKVAALLAIGSYADAAAVAAKSRDPDLIFSAMEAYERSLSSNEEGKSLYFSGVINKFPNEAVNMFTSYYSRFGSLQGGDARPSINILLRRQKHTDAGLKMAQKALSMKSPGMSESELGKQKIDALKEAANIFDLGGKDCAFQKTCTDEQIALMTEQEQLRRSYGSHDVAPPSTSVNSTLVSILKYGAVNPRSTHRLNADVEKLAKKFKVPEKRLWHIKVRALAESHQWPLLRNLADSRVKPPISLKHFAMAAIKGGQSQVEIMFYIDRMQDKNDGDDRYDLFCEAGYWKKALEEAVAKGDGGKIANVRSTCHDPDIQRLCEKYI